ncbi:hypothetical protein [Candidatus Merdisoma sp. JLR.KK006]|uniref:hypothetical protein n=1 Tax=Candidatus Merdisoma sp. JLR.KK006 TaxID=3112626 RepID=UPI002FF056F1
MQNIIRFSIFGNFERFNTNNLDMYLKLIDFFRQKSYKPATANELQLQTSGQAGQARIIIMPIFFNDMGASVEISSNRINFQKIIDIKSSVSSLNEAFRNEFTDLLSLFLADMELTANRVALNYDIFDIKINNKMPIVSSYYKSSNNVEMSVRNMSRIMVENENSNVITEKYVDLSNNIVKYSYDINTMAENQIMRFNFSNIPKMYKSYMDISLEIEKGME